MSSPKETMANDTSGEADSHAHHTTQTSLLWSIPCHLSNRLLHLFRAFSPNLLSLSKSFLPLPPIRMCLSGSPSSTWIMKVWIFCANREKMVLLRSGMDTWREPRSVCQSSIVVQHLTDISHFRIPSVDEILLPYSLILSSLCTRTNRLSPNLFL